MLSCPFPPVPYRLWDCRKASPVYFLYILFLYVPQATLPRPSRQGLAVCPPSLRSPGTLVLQFILQEHVRFRHYLYVTPCCRWFLNKFWGFFQVRSEDSQETRNPAQTHREFCQGLFLQITGSAFHAACFSLSWLAFQWVPIIIRILSLFFCLS